MHFVPLAAIWSIDLEHSFRIYLSYYSIYLSRLFYRVFLFLFFQFRFNTVHSSQEIINPSRLVLHNVCNGRYLMYWGWVDASNWSWTVLLCIGHLLLLLLLLGMLWIWSIRIINKLTVRLAHICLICIHIVVLTFVFIPPWPHEISPVLFESLTKLFLSFFLRFYFFFQASYWQNHTAYMYWPF